MRSRRLLALLSLCVTPLLGVALLNPTPASGHSRSDRAAAVSTLLDWQRIAIDTVFVDGRMVVPPLPPTAPPAPVPVPVGTLFLGYTSLAVYDAVQEANHRDRSSSSAAIAAAAHDVLAHYLPNTQAMLDTAYARTLATLPASQTTTTAIGK